MIFEYLCEKCSLSKEVVKPADEHRSEERCTCCDGPMIRLFSPPQLMGIHFDAHFNYGLGEHVSTKREYKQKIKDKGFVEVGTEKPESMEKYFNQVKQERHKRSWESV